MSLLSLDEALARLLDAAVPGIGPPGNFIRRGDTMHFPPYSGLLS